MTRGPVPGGGGPGTARRPRYQDLMRHRVEHILLVASLYDSFILTEDGQLNEALLRQYLDFHLTRPSDLTRVSTAEEALDALGGSLRFDLVITTPHPSGMDAGEFARRVRETGTEAPVVLLAFSSGELAGFAGASDPSAIDRVYLWQGDARILLAIVKQAEDRMNAPRDVGLMGVPVILVVEDDPRYWSSFLPVIYTELIRHTRGLLAEGLNVSEKLLRVRARPKVLLSDSFEEAWSVFQRYEEHVQGIITDVEFPWNGVKSPGAGAELAGRVRAVRPDIPIVLQSSSPGGAEAAEAIQAAFLPKVSPSMLLDLRKVLAELFGFGDFVFRMPDGSEVDRARDLPELLRKLHTVPAESIAYHGGRNHFSSWLKARTELRLAQALRARKVSDYPTLEDVRQDLVASIGSYRLARDRVIVADFDRGKGEAPAPIARIGGGSMGGKARGLAFANRLLIDSGIESRFPGIRISVPPFVVLGTDVFDQFLEENRLRDLALGEAPEEEVKARFLGGAFPEAARKDLQAYLAETRYPLAVRSSSLLEDLPEAPFAGIYDTWMLPNRDPDPERRLAELLRAVRRVYASTYSHRAKSFLRMTPYRHEEEKMAVLIQRIVGADHGSRFYPDFAGVARSHNFYPTPPLRAEDGLVAVALGFGATVVDGGTCLRFCPRYPRHLPGFSSVEEILANSQREFYALSAAGDGGGELRLYGLDAAEADGTLAAVGSTYRPEDHAVSPGITRPGVRLVTFAPVLQLGAFPLAEIMSSLLEIAARGTSGPVEIEFAVTCTPRGEEPALGFLQMRPVPLARPIEVQEMEGIPESRVLVRSDCILGNGKIGDIEDIVVVGYHHFERSRSREAAAEVARWNARLLAEGRHYLLVGVGRWGSADPFLGIPVDWDEVAGARVIVEAGFRDFKVVPSQGTHFFQNLISCATGYFTVNPEAGEGTVDWDWLAAQPTLDGTDLVRRIRLDAPLTVLMDGRRGEGLILKPS